MVCENCGKEHNGSYGSGRFCSKECARAFSTKNSQGQLKEAKCIDCGKLIYIGKRGSEKTCKCEECKSKILKSKYIKSTIKLKSKQSKIKYCKICGSEIGKCKDKYVCQHYRIFPTLIKFGLDQSKIGTIEIINEFYRIKDILSNEYLINRITENELKEKYNYNSGISNFHKILKSLNIETLNNSQANKLAIELGRIKPGGFMYFHEYLHKSWNNNIYHLRSSYEDIYANELDRNKINYEYESLIIKYFDNQKNIYRYAIPDFYLIDTNTIVEIKSSFTLDKQNMIDKKKAYLEQGYNFKLICDFKELAV